MEVKKKGAQYCKRDLGLFEEERTLRAEIHIGGDKGPPDKRQILMARNWNYMPSKLKKLVMLYLQHLGFLLLDFEHFRRTIDAYHFTKLLRGVLKSDIPLYHKDWVAACLVKLSSLFGPYSGFENPINMEMTLYETIPRLVEQMKTSFSLEVQDAAVVELNRIISEGVVDSTRAVSAEGEIFPLVKLIENGTERAVDAGLAILYNLSMDSENHAAIIAAGAVPILRKIVLSQRSHWTRALRLLRNLPT
nr:uncharacterized protein LOC109156869 isoform X2 [Ipomoea trifida]